MSTANSGNPQKPKKRARKRGRTHDNKVTDSTLSLLDQLLMRPRSMSLNGEKLQLQTIKVILLQLLQKEMAGDRRARNVLHKYREFASRTEAQKFELRFADSETARATAANDPGGENG